MMAVEWRVPHARAASAEDAWFNVLYALIAMILIASLRPLAMLVPLWLTKTVGTGWISFAPSFPGWCAAFLALPFTNDLLVYIYHRAQHAVPVLWRMHELHHSAGHFDVAVSYRHFWVDPLLQMVFLYPLIGILFKPPASALLAVLAVNQVFQYLAHMNSGFSPRRFGLLITHPPYHRIHHSPHQRERFADRCSMSSST